MHLEIEQKFPVNDLAAVRSSLEALGAAFEPAVSQTDLYFRHPARDFAQTDEALRLRRVGSENCITYKGPKIDEQTKTRREIELPIALRQEGFEGWVELLEVLGFRRSLEVRKERTPGALTWDGQVVQLALDQVAELGSFLELEIVADESEFESARNCVLHLAENLGLTQVERRGYLTLLLSKNVAQSKR